MLFHNYFWQMRQWSQLEKFLHNNKYLKTNQKHVMAGQVQASLPHYITAKQSQNILVLLANRTICLPSLHFSQPKAQQVCLLCWINLF